MLWEPMGFSVLHFHPAVKPRRMGKFFTSSSLAEPPRAEEGAHSSQGAAQLARQGKAWSAKQIQGQTGTCRGAPWLCSLSP